MENHSVIVVCALCFIFNQIMTAPIIKASGVQWSEPKGTGKGNITLIMIPQNNSCGNDSDMIVAVKSDYQIVSQDTQLLNLVVNENTANKTNASRCDTSFNKCSSLKEDISNNQEKDKMCIHPNPAKYFESENRLSSENTTNNTVNVYPVLVKNYQNLVAHNETLTTLSPNTVNVFQLLNSNASNYKSLSANNGKVSNYSHSNNATSNYNRLNLTEPNSHSSMHDNVKNKNDSISSMVGSDDNFLSEALNILEKLKQDPSYYNKMKSNQFPSLEEIKENGGTSLTGSKTKILKSDDSALASDEGESLVQEFGNINHESHEISNLEGNANGNTPTSTCIPFFMSFSSEETTTQLSVLNSPNEVLFEKIPLKGIGSNVSQELNILDNATRLDKSGSFTSTCKPQVPNNGVAETPQTSFSPVQSYISISVGYGVQSNDSSQTLYIKSCKPSNGLYTDSTNVTSPTITAEHGVGTAENVTSISKDEPNYLQQTLAAAKIAAGSELGITGPSTSFAVTSLSVSGSSTNQTVECITSPPTSATLDPPKLEQVNKAPSAAEMKSPNISENQVLNISKTDNPVTKPDATDQSLLLRPTVPPDGIMSQNLPKQNELETKTTECVTNALIQTISPIVVSPTSTNNVAAAGLNSLSGLTTECVTDSDVKVSQELGLPQAGVGAVPKKITLEPQVTCGTMKNENISNTSHPMQGQEACLNDIDLTLPLVKSSIFLANNNEMPKGQDIPISLNASIDEFSLSDLQEKEDRMNGKVAELYNRNPLIFNVEREPTGTILKPQPKYYKNDILKSRTFYFDKIYNPDSNPLLKMNFAGKNVILEKRPSYKSETNNKMCNNTLENSKNLTNYETEPGDSDSIEHPELLALTTPLIIISTKSNVYSGIGQNYLDTTIKLLDSHQSANEEEKLRTILNTFDKTTIGNVNLLGLPIVSPHNNTVYTPMPNNVDNVLKPQELGQNGTNVGGTSGQQNNENMNSQLNDLISLTTNKPYLSQTPTQKPIGIQPGKICSKPNKSKTKESKTAPGISRTSSGNEKTQEKIPHTKDKMCIPADSVQKIVIEIVRNTQKPGTNLNSYKETPKYDNSGNLKNMERKKEKNSYNEMKNMKQNFVPFESAWMPVQTKEKQTGFSLSDSVQPNSDYRNDKIKDSLKPEIYESDNVQDNSLQTQYDNRLSENQNGYKQEQIPTNEYNPNVENSKNYDNSLGANILKLLMADKSAVTKK